MGKYTFTVEYYDGETEEITATAMNIIAARRVVTAICKINRKKIPKDIQLKMAISL